MGKQQNQPQNQPKTSLKKHGNAKDLFKNKYIFEYSFFDLVRDGITCYYTQLKKKEEESKSQNNERPSTRVNSNTLTSQSLEKIHQYIQTTRFTQAVSLSLDYKNRVKGRRKRHLYY